VSVVLLLSGRGLAQQVVTGRATIPFNFWAQGHEFQAGDYVFDNEVPGSAAIHREGTNLGIGVSIILYAVPQEKETRRVIFVLRDGKCFLFELWSVQASTWLLPTSGIADTPEIRDLQFLFTDGDSFFHIRSEFASSVTSGLKRRLNYLPSIR
jgi:hypothetical protein